MHWLFLQAVTTDLEVRARENLRDAAASIAPGDLQAAIWGDGGPPAPKGGGAGGRIINVVALAHPAYAYPSDNAGEGMLLRLRNISMRDR